MTYHIPKKSLSAATDDGEDIMRKSKELIAKWSKDVKATISAEDYKPLSISLKSENKPSNANYANSMWKHKLHPDLQVKLDTGKPLRNLISQINYKIHLLERLPIATEMIRASGGWEIFLVDPDDSVLPKIVATIIFENYSKELESSLEFIESPVLSIDELAKLLPAKPWSENVSSLMSKFDKAIKSATKEKNATPETIAAACKPSFKNWKDELLGAEGMTQAIEFETLMLRNLHKNISLEDDLHVQRQVGLERYSHLNTLPAFRTLREDMSMTRFIIMPMLNMEHSGLAARLQQLTDDIPITILEDLFINGASVDGIFKLLTNTVKQQWPQNNSKLKAQWNELVRAFKAIFSKKIMIGHAIDALQAKVMDFVTAYNEQVALAAQFWPDHIRNESWQFEFRNVTAFEVTFTAIYQFGANICDEFLPDVDSEWRVLLAQLKARANERHANTDPVLLHTIEINLLLDQLKQFDIKNLTAAKATMLSYEEVINLTKTEKQKKKADKPLEESASVLQAVKKAREGNYQKSSQPLSPSRNAARSVPGLFLPLDGNKCPLCYSETHGPWANCKAFCMAIATKDTNKYMPPGMVNWIEQVHSFKFDPDNYRWCMDPETLATALELAKQNKSVKVTFGATPDDQLWVDAERRHANARQKRFSPRGQGGRGKGGKGSGSTYGSRYDTSRYGPTTPPPPGSSGSTISTASTASSTEHGSFEPWVLEEDDESIERSVDSNSGD